MANIYQVGVPWKRIGNPDILKPTIDASALVQAAKELMAEQQVDATFPPAFVGKRGLLNSRYHTGTCILPCENFGGIRRGCEYIDNWSPAAVECSSEKYCMEMTKKEKSKMKCI